MMKWWRWTLVGLVLLAFFLRLRGLFANTFHADEALFASWARLIAVWRDPLLATQAVDKPPLLFYLQALFYPLQGPVEWAARLPNFVASLLLVPLTAVFAHYLEREPQISQIFSGPLIAAAVVAFSPLAIQFSATAFTDPLLTFWLTASLTAFVASCLPVRGETARRGDVSFDQGDTAPSRPYPS
ncbi:MAG: phospholipid carrier-dependent glycosyltransferase, partial [Chloroflexi bacterium]|nr:phospholipid carrier-dependent glycosyltransferase [Chloroflexota bacterium]